MFSSERPYGFKMKHAIHMHLHKLSQKMLNPTPVEFFCYNSKKSAKYAQPKNYGLSLETTIVTYEDSQQFPSFGTPSLFLSMLVTKRNVYSDFLFRLSYWLWNSTCLLWAIRTMPTWLFEHYHDLSTLIWYKWCRQAQVNPCYIGGGGERQGNKSVQST